MIDTDKYEGQTRGPWRYYADEKHGYWVFEGEDIEAQARVEFFAFELVSPPPNLEDPDLNLILDAPELLAALISERAEVKRLRQLIKDIGHDYMSYLQARIEAESE